MVIFLSAGESYVRGTEQINLLELGMRSKIDELATAFLAEGFFCRNRSIFRIYLEKQETVQSVTEKRITQHFYSAKSAIQRRTGPRK